MILQHSGALNCRATWTGGTRCLCLGSKQALQMLLLNLLPAWGGAEVVFHSYKTLGLHQHCVLKLQNYILGLDLSHQLNIACKHRTEPPGQHAAATSRTCSLTLWTVGVFAVARVIGKFSLSWHLPICYDPVCALSPEVSKKKITRLDIRF